MINVLKLEKVDDIPSGIFINDLSEYKIVKKDTDCFDKNTGQLLFKLRKGVISEISRNTFKSAIPRVTSISKNGTNRALSQIEANLKDGVDIHDGNENMSLEDRLAKLVHIRSNIWGSYDRPKRNSNEGNCRKTALTVKHYEKWKMMHPLVQEINKLYSELTPKEYKLQKRFINTDVYQNWCIPKTVYSTITINGDTQMVTHRDSQDFKKGFGNLVTLRYGNYKGGETLFPNYHVGVDLQEGDMLIMNVHELHCNGPIIGTGRVSIVCYLRENINKCTENKL